MKQTYYLNGESLPTIPTPHDCYITAVELKDGWLTFTFDDDIMHGEDCPIGSDCKFDCIRFHIDELVFDDGILVCRGNIKRKKWIYKEVGLDYLRKVLCRGNLEYMYHFVAFGGIIIQLFYGKKGSAEWAHYEITIDTDMVEIEWSKRQ